MSISEEDIDQDEHYRLLASGRIAERQKQEAAGIHADKERIEQLLNSIAMLPRGFGQHPVLGEWAQQMRTVINESEEPDWNYRYAPNCRLIYHTLDKVKQFGDFEPSGLRELFNFTQLPVAFFELRRKWEVSHVAKQLKNLQDGRRQMLSILLDEIDRTADKQKNTALKAWVHSVKQMFVAYLDYEHNWVKIQDFLVQITKPEPEMLYHRTRGLSPLDILVDKQGRITPDNSPQHLPTKLGLVARPDPGVLREKVNKRALLNPFAFHSLSEHHRIGRRQAALRELETLGDARNGGLLLA